MVIKSNKKEKSRASKKIKHVILAGTLAVFTGLASFYAANQWKKQPVNYGQIAALNGVEEIVDYRGDIPDVRGDIPDVIVILQSHINQNESDQGVYKRTADVRSIDYIFSICNRLYDGFGVRSLLPEGLDPSLEEMYEKNRRVSFRSYDSTGYVASLERLINGRKWILHFAENPSNRDEIEKLKAPLEGVYKKVLDETSRQVESCTRRYSIPLSLEDEFHQKLEIDKILKEANKRLQEGLDSFFTPEISQRIYDLTITQRDLRYAQVCRAAKEQGKTPIILIYGSAHFSTLPQHLESMNYIIIRPKGIDELKPVSPDSIKERYSLMLRISQ